MPSISPKKTGTTAPLISVILGAILFVGAVWMWWSLIYMSNDRVFKDMLGNSMNIYGYTKTIKQKDENSTLEQKSQAVFGSQTAVRSLTTITQTANNQNSKVVSESIGSKDETYSRYNEINTSEKAKNGQPIDFTSIVNMWGKQDVSGTGQSAIGEAMFGIVPFGLLPQTQRSEMVKFMLDKNVYTYRRVSDSPDASSSNYVFNVKIDPVTYIESLKKFDQMAGLNQLQNVDPGQYAGSQPIEVQLVINKHSRVISKIAFIGGGREENLSGYGIRSVFEIPGQSIPHSELETKLQQILQNSSR